MDAKTKSNLWFNLKFSLAIFFFTWQSVAGILGIAIYLLLSHYNKSRDKWLIPLLSAGALACVDFYARTFYRVNIFSRFITNSLTTNVNFWDTLKSADTWSSFLSYFNGNYNLMIGATILIIGFLSLVDAIDSPIRAEINK